MNTEEMLSAARQFVDVELRPLAGHMDRRGQYERALALELGKRGFLAAPLPVRYGGLGIDAAAYGELTEIIGRACSSTRTLLTVHCSLVCETLAKWGTAAQKDQWLPDLATGKKIAAFALTEAQAGSDTSSLLTNCRKEGGRLVLCGQKKWVSFGGVADVFLVFSKYREGTCAVLVDRAMPGVTVRALNGMLACRASHIAEVDFDGVSIDGDRVVGPLEGGSELMLAAALDNGRYSVAWGGVAIAMESCKLMIDHARQRRQFGRPISEFQHIQGLIADSATAARAARALSQEAGVMRIQRDLDATVRTCMAKYFASKVAVEVSGKAIQVHGAIGLSSESPIERLFRDAKCLEIIEGTSQINQSLIADDVTSEGIR